LLKKDQIYVTVFGDDGKAKGRLYNVVEGVEFARRDDEELKDTFNEEVKESMQSMKLRNWSAGDEKMYSVSDENLEVLRDISKLEKKLEKDNGLLPAQAKRLNHLKLLRYLWRRKTTAEITKEETERLEKLRKEEKAVKEAEKAKEPKD
jgi:hypothetical protein